MFKNKKILVAGGSGFIGSNLIKKLLELGANVVSTLHGSSMPPKRDFDWSKVLLHYVVDLTKKEDCERVVKDVDYVFMCAGNTSGAAVMEKTPLVHVTPNVLMNTLMLEASYKFNVEKFIFLSSTTVYPVEAYPMKENDADGDNLFDKYFCVASMKLFTERLCEIYSTKIKRPMKTIVIRPANVYGPYDDFEWETSHVVPALIRKVVEKHNPIEVWGDGKDIKDIIYIDDFIDGLLLAADKLNDFTILNLASGQSVTVMDILNNSFEIENCGNEVNIVFDKSKPTMIPVRLVDTSKAEKILGFTAKTTLKEGLRKTIEWYKNYHKS